MKTLIHSPAPEHKVSPQGQISITRGIPERYMPPMRSDMRKIIIQILILVILWVLFVWLLATLSGAAHVAQRI
jgi:cell division septal protein FtsQ